MRPIWTVRSVRSVSCGESWWVMVHHDSRASLGNTASPASGNTKSQNNTLQHYSKLCHQSSSYSIHLYPVFILALSFIYSFLHQYYPCSTFQRQTRSPGTKGKRFDYSLWVPLKPLSMTILCPDCSVAEVKLNLCKGWKANHMIVGGFSSVAYMAQAQRR